MISLINWKVNGVSSKEYSSLFNDLYNKEINNSNLNIVSKYSAKIGLMYISDYIYSSKVEDWNTAVGRYVDEDGANPNDNWMYIGAREWTITHDYENDDMVGMLDDTGSIGFYPEAGEFGIRPVFYLNSDVELAGGSGTSTDPYRIKI